jgi:hypothetical protein
MKMEEKTSFEEIEKNLIRFNKIFQTLNPHFLRTVYA